MKVYIICAENGEYSDRRDWRVAAYESLDDAEEHVALLRAENLRASRDELNPLGYIKEGYKNIFDPSHDYNYHSPASFSHNFQSPGTTYTIETFDSKKPYNLGASPSALCY